MSTVTAIKIWARAEVIHEHENPELFQRVVDVETSTLVERAFIIRVEALEWNCSKHIPQRFTQTEIKEILLPLMAENEQLKARLARYENKSGD